MTLLSERSKMIRRETLKLSIANGGYHFGGSFSCVEILLALFDHTLRDEDAFILSKGHSCWPLYVLLRERGLNPKLEGHPHRDPAQGVVSTTGSEGHGLPTALGMALARKQTGRPGRVFVLMGDGECQEGTTWESFLTASFRKLDNLVVIVDFNDIQGSGFTHEILPVDRLHRVASDLGWFVDDVQGHDVDALARRLKTALPGMPKLLVARTVKGCGVSFMERRPEWHSKWPNAEQQAAILGELE